MPESYENRLSAADELIDRAADQIQHAEPPPEQVAQAANRVWEQLSGKLVARRGMKLVKSGDLPSTLDDQLRTEDSAAREPERSTWRTLRPWAIAALLLLGIGTAQIAMRALWPAGPSATVQTVDGQLFRVTDSSQLPVIEGTEILEGEVVRTGRDGGAVVRLADGSLVELAARSEMSIDEGRRGTTIRLERGNVIVEAAEQRDRHLYVATDDCLVSVTGTIFSVNSGTKGSKVAVIEGEVRVDHRGDETVLHPGDQVTTHQLMASTTVVDEISWSQNVDTYIEILRQFDALERDIAANVPHPALRFSSRLLDLMPADTAFYGAAPNVAETVTGTHRLLMERLDQSPELQQWWATESASQFQDSMNEVMAGLTELGSYLGQEVAVGGYLETGESGEEQLGGLVALAEVVDADGLRDFAERKIAELQAEHGLPAHRPGNGDGHLGEGPSDLIFVDDPRALVGERGDHLYVWLYDDLMVATIDPARMREEAALVLDGATNPFVGSDFHTEIRRLYDEGAEFLLAADLGRVIDLAEKHDPQQAEGHGDSGPSLAALGIDNARHLMVEQKRLGTKTQHRVAATFDEARHGLASWLAEPAPMGGLSFVSPDAKLVASVVFEDPTKLLDDMFSIAGEVPQGLSEFEQRYGLSLRDDFAASIGGEMLIALDGPILPNPAWKIVIEIYDPARFQWTIEQALVEANTQLQAAGQPPLVLEESQVNGHTAYTLPAQIVDVHYTFVQGYLVMAPSKALLDQAIRYHDSGYSITESPKFQALLPQDGRSNFSAIVYQDLTSSLATVAESLIEDQLTDEQRQALEAFTARAEPALGYAYGETDRIILAGSSDGNVLTSLLLRGLGLKDPAGFEALLGPILESAI